MTYEIIWTERAINQAAGFLKDDPEGLEQLLSAVDHLADEPRPAGTSEYGSPLCAGSMSAATACCMTSARRR